MSYDPQYLQQLIKEKNVSTLKNYMDEHHLKIVDNKIVQDPEYHKKQHDFWDMRQHSRKILLNS